MSTSFTNPGEIHIMNNLLKSTFLLSVKPRITTFSLRYFIDKLTQGYYCTYLPDLNKFIVIYINKQLKCL